jgi:DNA-binding GntR family transcriptional regulator
VNIRAGLLTDEVEHVFIALDCPARLQLLGDIGLHGGPLGNSAHQPDAESHRADVVVAGYLRNNQNFKFTIYKAAQMPSLVDLIERLWQQIGPFMNHYARGMPYPLLKDTHRQEILTALRRRDPVEARKALEKDVLYGMEFLKKIAEETSSHERA